MSSSKDNMKEQRAGELTGEKLPYAEIHSQAKVLLTLAKGVLQSLPGFQQAAARAFWRGTTDTISFQDKDSANVRVVYYLNKNNKRRSDKTETFLYIYKTSVENNTGIRIELGHDEDTNEAIARRNRLGEYEEFPRKSSIAYGTLDTRPGVLVMIDAKTQIENTQQAIDEIKIFIESLK